VATSERKYETKEPEPDATTAENTKERSRRNRGARRERKQKKRGEVR
jgi:hypothetical protein